MSAAQPGERLPEGVLVAWYGDDFTGSAAVMEALTFAGLPSVLFFDVPTAEQLDRFSGHRGIGIGGIARSKGPAWMGEALPPIFTALAGLNARVNHYKICSTLDSSPEVGSIGRAIEIAAPLLGGRWHPLLPAAPPIHRYQAFGNLFASVGGTPFRLDRHPTMSRHPVTPIREADVRLHLASQTALPIGLVDLVALKSGRARDVLAAEIEQGAAVVALDVVDEETLRIAGELIWESRPPRILAVGSQGVEYAIIAYWRSKGLLPETPPDFRADPAHRIAAASGSCSPVTAGQIDWAEDHGFAPIRIDAARAVDPAAWTAEGYRAVEAALAMLSSGRDPIIYTARGAQDPAIADLRRAVEVAGADTSDVNARIGDGLGRCLDTILRRARINRAAIAGGDTSSYGALALGAYALTALAATVPGAALFKAHSENPAHARLELGLKGGQMGDPDYFGRIKSGGAPTQ